MDLNLGSRMKHAWNAFMNKDPTIPTTGYGGGFYVPQYRTNYNSGNDKSIVTSICNRIALDIAAIEIKHCQLDEEDRYLYTIDSSLNRCFSLEANVDQTGRAFIQDVVMSMLDEGHVAIVPTDTVNDPTKGFYSIEELRAGRVTQWFPSHVKVQVYNEMTGQKQEVTLPKSMVAIVENPLYSVMNAPNSTLQRLKRTLNLLDQIDARNSSGKLDLIIQLPYVVKTDLRRNQAEQRRADIEKQLTGSRYGVAYTDGTEKIIQLNRPIDNQLQTRVEYLQDMLYGQLGITKEVLNGSADEKVMLNYNNRTIEPILSAIVDEMKRKFLTKNARSRGQSIMFFRDPFRLAPINDIAELADKFTRNEIMTSNEIRQKVGLVPSQDPKADQLVNSNLNQATEDPSMMDPNAVGTEEEAVPEEEVGYEGE